MQKVSCNHLSWEETASHVSSVYVVIFRSNVLSSLSVFPTVLLPAFRCVRCCDVMGSQTGGMVRITLRAVGTATGILIRAPDTLAVYFLLYLHARFDVFRFFVHLSHFSLFHSNFKYCVAPHVRGFENSLSVLLFSSRLGKSGRFAFSFPMASCSISPGIWFSTVFRSRSLSVSSHLSLSLIHGRSKMEILLTLAHPNQESLPLLLLSLLVLEVVTPALA